MGYNSFFEVYFDGTAVYNPKYSLLLVLNWHGGSFWSTKTTKN